MDKKQLLIGVAMFSMLAAGGLSAKETKKADDHKGMGTCEEANDCKGKAGCGAVKGTNDCAHAKHENMSKADCKKLKGKFTPNA